MILRISDGELPDVVKAVFPGNRAAHDFLLGDFGSGIQSYVGVVHADTMAPFTIIAAKRSKDPKKTFEAVPIEPLVDTRWAGWDIDELTTADVDGSGKQSVIVMAEFMTGIGPEGAKPFLQTLVYEWNGSKFVHLKDVEKKLEDAKNADEVHARLGALKKAQ